MTDSPVLVERRGDVATITMNRPDRRNALSLGDSPLPPTLPAATADSLPPGCRFVRTWTSVVTETFERNGHDYVRYDVLVVCDDEPVMLVEHTAIYAVQGPSR